MNQEQRVKLIKEWNRKIAYAIIAKEEIALSNTIISAIEQAEKIGYDKGKIEGMKVKMYSKSFVRGQDGQD